LTCCGSGLRYRLRCSGPRFGPCRALGAVCRNDCGVRAPGSARAGLWVRYAVTITAYVPRSVPRGALLAMRAPAATRAAAMNSSLRRTDYESRMTGLAEGMTAGQDVNKGAPDRTRTCGLLLRRQTLYPLSYGGRCGNDPRLRIVAG